MDGHPNSTALYARLLGHVKPYRKGFYAGVLALAVGGGLQGAFPLFLKELLDKVFVESGRDYALAGAIAIVAIFTLAGIAHFIAGYSMNWVGNKVILDFRSLMFQRLLKVPVPFYSSNTTGTLMSKLTYDVVGLQEASTNALIALIRGSFTLIGVLITMFIISWQLTLIIFATGPVLAWIMQTFSRRLRTVARESQTAWGAMNDVLEESIRGHKVIKVFTGERFELQRFDEAANRIRKLSMKHIAAAAAATPLTHFVVSLAIALIVYLAASKTVGTGLTMSEFVTFVVAAGSMIPQVKGLSNVNEQIQRGLASAESVFRLIDEPVEEDRGSVAMTRAEGRIGFEDVHLSYDSQSQAALNGVTLAIRPGETVALVGSSGSGKTSLINLLPRFYAPSSGRVTLDGHPLGEIRLPDLRAQLAMVSQDVVLFGASVAANIAYGSSGPVDRARVEQAARAAHCSEFVAALPDGFDTHIGENGSRLSGGQRQRIAIARALYKDAPILLLDEATSALDSESERQVQAALEALMKDRTTLVVAHRLSTIEKADRIVVMDQGRILEIGSHAELVARGGQYATLLNLQLAGM
ncbi:MAG TPA: lipid A export permease/ATP-binding protein MsbA [Usitatibacteraceae bacterium]|nr:lipid A export permease/ATP-binding protein MsbA [Usitatibacteraceae bacterium]